MEINKHLSHLDNLIKSMVTSQPINENSFQGNYNTSTNLGPTVYGNDAPLTESEMGDKAMKAIASRYGYDGTQQRQGNLNQIMQENETKFQKEQDEMKKAQEHIPLFLDNLIRSFKTKLNIAFNVVKPFSHMGDIAIDSMSGSQMTGPEYVEIMKSNSQYIEGILVAKADSNTDIPMDFREYLLESGLKLVLKSVHNIGKGFLQFNFEDDFGRNHEFTSDNMLKFFSNTEEIA